MAKEKGNKNISIKDRYLTFDLEFEKYGVEILRVKEIIGLQKVVSVPKTPPFVKGVMNLRGLIIPVIDLRLKLQMSENKPQMDTAIIILLINNVSVGFIVDRVDEVALVSQDSLSEPPKFGSKIDVEFIKHMAKTKEHVIMILDLEKIFDAQELSSLEKMAK